MNKTLGIIALSAICLTAASSSAQQAGQRESLTLPPASKAIILGQMRGHIDGLNKVITALSQGQYKRAGESARNELGVPRFQDDGQGKDKGPGLGVGKDLPVGFRMLSRSFRVAAINFNDLVQSLPATPSPAEHQQIYKALGEITSKCSSCHDAYKLD